MAEQPDDDNRPKILALFLEGVPTIELERLITQRADEHLRKIIRDAYRASRWCDSAESGSATARGG